MLPSIWWCSFCLWNYRVVKWNKKCYQSLYQHGGKLEMIHGLWVWICRIHLNVLSLKEKVPMFYHPCPSSCICLSKSSPLFLPPILFNQSWIWTSSDPASSSIFCYQSCASEYLCVLDCISIWKIVIVLIPFGQLDTLLSLCWLKMWAQDGIALHPGL